MKALIILLAGLLTLSGLQREVGSAAGIRSIYRAELGVREATGRNDGSRVEEYLRYVGLKKGQPWCASFVCWALGKAGIDNPRSGYCPRLFGRDKLVWERRRGGGGLNLASYDGGPVAPVQSAAAGVLSRKGRFADVGGENEGLSGRGLISRKSRFANVAVENAGLGALALTSRSSLFADVAAENEGFSARSVINRKSLFLSDAGEMGSSVPSVLISRQAIFRASGAETGDLASGDSALVFGLYFPEKGRIAHVGFVDALAGKYIITVEGNTNEAGSREGDGVYCKRRLLSSVYQIACYKKHSAAMFRRGDVLRLNALARY